MKTGAEIQLQWLSNLTKRTKRFQVELAPTKELIFEGIVLTVEKKAAFSSVR
jgi:hypothetical protein